MVHEERAHSWGEILGLLLAVVVLMGVGLWGQYEWVQATCPVGVRYGAGGFSCPAVYVIPDRGVVAQPTAVVP